MFDSSKRSISTFTFLLTMTMNEGKPQLVFDVVVSRREDQAVEIAEYGSILSNVLGHRRPYQS